MGTWQSVVLGVLVVGLVVFLLCGATKRLTWSDAGACSLILGFVVAMALVIPWEIHRDREWRRWCAGQGGHVSSHTTWTYGTSLDSKGRPYSTQHSNTTYYCLSADGRILDIR